MKVPNIHLLGIQGSGKGTQAALLVEQYGFTYVGSGNLLRQRAAVDDQFGRDLKALLGAGTLVPDAVLVETVRYFLQNHDTSKGIVGDGVLRTKEQYELLLPVWEEFGLDAPHVVYLELSEFAAELRIAKRREEAERGERVEHHKTYSGKLLHRTDDNPDSIANRFMLFRRLTKPLVDVFESHGHCIRVDANEGVHKVYEGVRVATETWYPNLQNAS